MNKKGFTLVELLAVIAILAILVIIALPNVMSMFNKAKKSSFETEVKEIYTNAKQQWINDSLTISSAQTYIKSESENCGKQLDMNIRNNLNYYVEMNGTGKITNLYVTDGTYQYKYNGSGLEKDNIGEAEIIANLQSESDKIVISCNSIRFNKKITDYINNIIDGNTSDIIDEGISDDESCKYTFAYDKTSDNNLRYVGKNPCNYIKFNNELWRIIGKVDGKIKIVKDGTLGAIDWTDAGKNDVANNDNDWTKSKIKTRLEEYYNSLPSKEKNMIYNQTWHLGGTSTEENWYVRKMYTAERGTNVYSGKPTSWTGKIALMYASDYGFATSGGNSLNRESCFNIKIIDWQNTLNSDCKSNNWLFSGENIWLLNPHADNPRQTFIIGKFGQVGLNGRYHISTTGQDYTSGHQLKPVLYLKDEVKIISGDGSENHPYIIE